MKLTKIVIPLLALCIKCRPGFAQADTIFVKGNQIILAGKIKDKCNQYSFTFLDAPFKKEKSMLLKNLVDSIKFNTKNLTTKKKKDKRPAFADTTCVPTEKAWQFTSSIGLSIGNVLEFNDPYGGPDKKSLSGSLSFDANAVYKKENKKLAMTHEVHYLFGLQKNGLSSSAHIQKVQDDITTLHDVSMGFKKNTKWNFNIIVRSTTSLCGLYDGDYFANYTGFGRTKGFASPYDVTVSPGIKYQPNDYFRISLSPYSFQLYGIKKQAIANKGIYITDLDALGNYKNFLFNRQGAEINIWYDRRIKEWLEMQYRLAFTANYFENLAKNGIMDGLFITRIKIVKDFYVTHRLTLKNSLSGNLLKPYFNQNILLSYSKAF